MPTSGIARVDFGEDIGGRESRRSVPSRACDRRGDRAGGLANAPRQPQAPRGCAPPYSGLMKLLSRWAGSTRALRAAGVVRAQRTCSSASAARRSARDGRRTERGDAVARQARAMETPRRRRRGCRHRRPVDVHVDEPRNDVVMVQCSPWWGRKTASDRISAMRPSSMTSVPGESTRSGSTSSAPGEHDHVCAACSHGARLRWPPRRRRASTARS